MLTVEDAMTAVLQHVKPIKSAVLPLADTLNLILAEDLITPHDSPPFDKSMMDGFAVNSSGFAATDSRQLDVLETITAGTVPQRDVTADSASRIMTGAAMPSGADAVVPIEHVQFSEDTPNTVGIPADRVTAERNVLRQGSLAQTGEPLMPAGTQLAPQHIAVLAEFGVAQLPVHRRPTVAVLATGDELLDIAEPLTPGHIRNSNEPMLVGQIRRAGGTAVALGVARDEREDLRSKILEGLKCDFLLLSGGVSAGTLDLVPNELAAAGVQEVFHKIKMKPGKPLWFGQLTSGERECHVFGLPGNPVSSMICFELFVRAAMRKFAGYPSPEPDYVSATLTEDIGVRGDRPVYFPCKITWGAEGMACTPVKWGGSADLRSTASADAMCLLQPQTQPYPAGTQVPAVRW